MQDYIKKNIAVLGVSDRPDKFGFRIFRDLTRAGFKVSGINPRGIQILGKNTYKNLRDIEEKPDVVITVVPPQVTEAAVKECADLGIKEIWMQPGSESDKSIGDARGYGIKVTHNACFMVENGIW